MLSSMAFPHHFSASLQFSHHYMRRLSTRGLHSSYKLFFYIHENYFIYYHSVARGEEHDYTFTAHNRTAGRSDALDEYGIHFFYKPFTSPLRSPRGNAFARQAGGPQTFGVPRSPRHSSQASDAHTGTPCRSRGAARSPLGSPRDSVTYPVNRRKGAPGGGAVKERTRSRSPRSNSPLSISPLLSPTPSHGTPRKSPRKSPRKTNDRFARSSRLKR